MLCRSRRCPHSKALCIVSGRKDHPVRRPRNFEWTARRTARRGTLWESRIGGKMWTWSAVMIYSNSSRLSKVRSVTAIAARGPTPNPTSRRNWPPYSSPSLPWKHKSSPRTIFHQNLWRISPKLMKSLYNPKQSYSTWSLNSILLPWKTTLLVRAIFQTQPFHPKTVK